MPALPAMPGDAPPLPAPSPARIIAAAHGPYEDLAIKALEVLEKIIDGQPPEVRRQVWQWYIEDMRGFRALVGLAP